VEGNPELVVEHKGDVIRPRLGSMRFLLFSIGSRAIRFGGAVSRLEYALFVRSRASRNASERPLVLREASS